MATKRRHRRVPWNKGKIVGQKAPLKLREIWASLSASMATAMAAVPIALGFHPNHMDLRASHFLS